ncbi:MAG: hypothetical protein HC772_06515 [Leptolyngbyaceae cyanobacterium CRU_2_3]|nr:hypothetical protein [Leptolyngbyaceae cyanobacterium CRU_2_3]
MEKFHKHDQLALVRALHTAHISVVELPKTYNISPLDAASLMLEKQPVHLLHCWGGMIASGKFRQFAQNFILTLWRQSFGNLGTIRLLPSLYESLDQF